MSPKTYREHKLPGWLFLGSSLLLSKCLTGNESPPEEQGPCLCKSDKVTSETKQRMEIFWLPGQHQESEDTEIQLYSFSAFQKKSFSRHKDFQLL